MEVQAADRRTTKPVKVSVIMGVYNQLDRAALDRAVDSILNQTLQDFEFIIYDDGSVPEGHQHIREQGRKDPRIRIYGQEQNNGLAFSLNVCAELAEGEYIARMDADDIARADRLEKQCAFLDENTAFDWCGSNASLFDGDRVWGHRVMPEHPEAEDYLRFSPFIHPSVMYRRRLLQKYQYSTDDATLRCEDYEIFMRLFLAGHRGYNLQEELLSYCENMQSYERRTLRHRFNESRIRYHSFREMGILFPRGWLYVLRPLLGAAVPAKVIAFLKKRESDHVCATRDQ